MTYSRGRKFDFTVLADDENPPRLWELHVSFFSLNVQEGFISQFRKLKVLIQDFSWHSEPNE